jgi:hypothetical protein
MAFKQAFKIAALIVVAVAAFAADADRAGGQATSFRVIGPGIVVVGESVYQLDTGNGPSGWKQLPNGTFTLPPVPASSLVNYASGIVAVTNTGEGWVQGGGVWTDVGPVPGLVPTTRESWGQLKAKYAR